MFGKREKKRGRWSRVVKERGTNDVSRGGWGEEEAAEERKKGKRLADLGGEGVNVSHKGTGRKKGEGSHTSTGRRKRDTSSHVN